MRLVIVRHGQTIENAGHVVQGQLPGRLSDLGLAQARLTGAGLRLEHFDAVYSSDLERAYRTASIIMEGRPSPAIVKETRLREQDFGVYEGKPVTRLLRQMKLDGSDFTTFAPEGGESPAAFCLRALKLYEELHSRHATDNILVVTHNGVINALLGFLVYNNTEKALDGIVDNGAITILNIDDSGRAMVETENDTEHLRDP